jgi:tetratricopeptide (TPR) repeat protein
MFGCGSRFAVAAALACAWTAQDPADRADFERRAAALAPDDADGRVRLGEFAEQRRLWDLALAAFERAVEIEPGHKRARERLGFKRSAEGWRRDAAAARLWTVRAAVAAGGVAFPDRDEIESWRRKGGAFARAVELILNLDHYVDAALAVDDRAGLFEGTLSIQVKFEDSGIKNVPATGWGRGGRGHIAIDLKKLADYLDIIAKYDRDRRAGAEVVVPPARPERILVHELTHCFQGGDNAGMPAWFIEGMATWCAQDGHYVAFFRHQRQEVKAIPDGVREHKYVYARGWAVFEFLDATHGREKVKAWIDRVVRKARPVDEAAAETFGRPWAEIVDDERKWSAEWIRRFRAKP